MLSFDVLREALPDPKGIEISTSSFLSVFISLWADSNAAGSQL
jgi:hypothetical protein